MLDYHCTGIQKFIFDRLCQIDEEIVDPDPEYKKLGERPEELLKQVAAKLSPEDNELLKEYDEVWFEQVLRREELTYSQGLMDGMLLGYWVAMVGNGMEKIKV
ncbi:MAG TPA: hypothetical protein DDW50_10870 [Firmicutes bacterium]|jgi:hypothetical protein|nr:hypothetical protein [Bacillota bacterium]